MLTYHLPANGQGISALAVDEEQKLIAAGTESEKEGVGDVAIYIWYVYCISLHCPLVPPLPSILLKPTSRSYANPVTPKLLCSYTESHTDTITSLRFHHTPPSTSSTSSTSLPASTLISTSTDSLISIFDPAHPDEDDALLTVFNNKAAVSHLCPFTVHSPSTQKPPALASALCAISHDEKLGVYEVEDAAVKAEVEAETQGENDEDLAPVWPELDVREALNADYAIRLLPRQSQQQFQAQEMVLAVGAYRPETLSQVAGAEGPIVSLYSGAPRLVDGKIEGFMCVARLIGAHGEDVVRDIWFDEDVEVVLTCGEDGFVRLWVDPSAPEGKIVNADVEMEGTGEVKESRGKRDRDERKKQKRKGERHKPY